jgi:beta-alanine--pyruvate transaminase
MSSNSAPADLEAFWMPFTANRQFKANPRCSARPRACTTGRRTAARSWTAPPACGASTPAMAARDRRGDRQQLGRDPGLRADVPDGPPHGVRAGRPPCSAAAGRPRPRLLHQLGFRGRRHRAEDRAGLSPRRGQGTRTRLIGRERGYHGVGFGGISVGGMVNNRKWFGPLLPGRGPSAAHPDLAERTPSPRAAGARRRIWPTRWSASSQPARRLQHRRRHRRALAGSTGVLVPPKGYLKRLREICDKHGILLIFDEVITGFGRLGTSFAAEKFGVIPDLMTAPRAHQRRRSRWAACSCASPSTTP